MNDPNVCAAHMVDASRFTKCSLLHAWNAAHINMKLTAATHDRVCVPHWPTVI